MTFSAKITIALAVVSVLSFMFPVHPAFGIAGLALSAMSGIWVLGKMEEDGLLS